MQITSSLHSIAAFEDNPRPENGVFHIPFTFTSCDGHFPLRDDPPQILRCCPDRDHPLRSQRFFVLRRRRVDRSLRVETRIDSPLLGDVGVTFFNQHDGHTIPSPVLESHRTAQDRVQHPTRSLPCRNADPTKQTTYHTSFHCLLPRAY